MQWLNFDGAPESQSFTFSNKMSPKKLGIGISGVNDKIGPLNNTSVAVFNDFIVYNLKFLIF